jgi:cytochrome P450
MAASTDTISSDPVPTGLQLTALDERFRTDPYPGLAELRAREPVHRDLVLNRIVFTRHDDVHAILRDPHHWSDPRKGNEGTFARQFLIGDGGEPSMLLMDDPGHQRLRSLVRGSFTPRSAERWRSRVRGVAERVVGEIEEADFDLIKCVAGPIPTVVIAEMLGIDAGMHEQFKAWSEAAVVVSFNPSPEPEDVAAATDAQVALDTFFRQEIEARRKESGDDLISEMLGSVEAGDRLADEEIVQLCNLLLIAGNVTTTDLIGNATKALLDHPDQLARLRHDDSLLPNTVEEVLRFDTPVTNSGRIAHDDMVIGGVEIERGETLAVSLAAANRDPDVYPDPNGFDITRTDTHHHAFGGGRHFCLGSHLARLEAQEALRALLSHIPHLSFGEGGHDYGAIPSFRGLERLWLHAGR